jgi:hypothetical protein
MDDKSEYFPIETSAAEPACDTEDIINAKEVRKWNVWTLAIIGGCAVAIVIIVLSIW